MSETYCFNADTSEGNFTILNNTCIRDARLSLKSKGLHTYFMSLPPKWKLYKSELVKHSRDGMESVNSAIKELVEYGYVEITEQKRSGNGRFSGNAYGFHAKPIKDIPEEILIDSKQNPSGNEYRRGFSVTVKPSTVKPSSENQQLLTTNILNEDKEKTEQTHSATEEEHESFFKNIVRELLCGDYPFDVNFQSTVLKQLADAGVDKSNLEAFLNYVYERTKLGNVKKSFVGLFRTLALSKSILGDFKNSNFIKRTEETIRSEPQIKYIDCPICSTRFKEFDFNCPICGVSLSEIQNKNAPGYLAKKRIYEMSESEKKQYEAALNEFKGLIKQQTGRSFLTEGEKIQFWKDNKII